MVPLSPRDQTRNSSNGRTPVTPSRRFFRSPSVEHVNGSATAHSAPNLLPSSRPAADSAFTPREQPSPRGDPGNTQRILQQQQQQHQMLVSPERRRPGADNDRTARAPPLPPPTYQSEHNRERPPPPPPSRPYDRERDWVREQQHEIERTQERERRWSLSEQRRFESDRRPLDSDRRPPSYDRRPPPHLDDKRPPGYVDRRPLDDRRFPPDYDRRPLSEESRFGIPPSQDMPSQEPHIANGNERRLSVSQAMKTGGPAAAPLASSSATPSSTNGTATHAMTPAPVDSADRDVAGDHRPISVHSSPAPMSVDGQRSSNARFVVPVDERSSSQVASSQDRISGTQPQLVPRAEPTRPGVLLSEGRPVRAPENTGIATPAQSVVEDVPHARVSEPPHPERFSISAAPVIVATGAGAADHQSRPVSVAASSHALSVGRDEPRLQPPPPPPPPRASSPSGVPSAHPSLSLRAREPSRERQPPTFRPSYFRSEFSRPPEDDRRLDVHPLPQPPPPPSGPGDGFRRYDDRSRWSPPPYADRRGGYREYYDRDRERDRERERAYWDSSKDYRPPPPPPRDRDRSHPPQSQPPHWDRGRARYSEPSYAGGSGGGGSGGNGGALADRRFSDDRDRDRDRWYPPPASTFVEVPTRRPFDTFLPRGPGPGPRPRSPGSPPPLKRARGDDGYAIPMSIVSGQGPPPPPSLPLSAAAVVTGGTGAPAPSSVPAGEYGDYPHQQPVPIPVPIPILRAASRSPPRYGHGHAHGHGRPLHMEPYGAPYGAYERDGGGRGPPGAPYAREGPR
ncbi:hypothetical protein BJY52DRAFT_180865 [Lactarius psammicola]|nr:hypothetical protein BJY52DRAFT_180865 [Lactarius psammicola]